MTEISMSRFCERRSVCRTDTQYVVQLSGYTWALQQLTGEDRPRILDAACGTGRYSVYLAARGHRVIGIDRSSEMLVKARLKRSQAEFLIGDLTALPLESDSVDAAVCALALVHLPDLGRAVAELARVVRPGGRIIVSDVHPFLIHLGWQAQFRTVSGDAAFMRLHAHLPSDYCEAYTAAGLRIHAFYEPLLTPAAAATPAADRLPEANRSAFVGLPGVIVWDLEKPLLLTEPLCPEQIENKDVYV